MSIINELKEKLIHSKYKPRIVYAEGWNHNIQIAATTVANNKTVEPILIFRTKNEVPTNFSLKHVVIGTMDLTKYANLLFELRKAKGMTESQASQLAKEPNFLAALMVKANDADGEICGIDYPTRDTLKPALQIIRTAPGAKLVTSAFVMERDNERYVMGDCAINLYPSADELANIAKMIAIFAHDTVDINDVRASLLSYSTCGSGAGESVDKVKGAYELLKNDVELKARHIEIFGEMQFDASFVPEVMQKKAKGITWTKPANTFIFPNIDAGNIGYKIAQRMGGFNAVGPVLIGLALPVNDLSRGASSDDVIGLSYITGNQVLNINK